MLLIHNGGARFSPKSAPQIGQIREFNGQIRKDTPFSLDSAGWLLRSLFPPPLAGEYVPMDLGIP